MRKAGWISCIALVGICPSLPAQEVRPAWANAQLELRRELRDWIEKSRALRREGSGTLNEASWAWAARGPECADYWLSGDPQTPFLFLQDLRNLSRSAGFEDGYYAELSPERILDPFVPLLVDLAYLAPRDGEVRDLLLDAAEHLGGWGAGDQRSQVPPWYDRGHHHFRSACPGTRRIPQIPPWAADIPANLRFLRLGLAAHLAEGGSRYLDWCRDYADEWVRDIRANGWVAPSEITVPTHEAGGFSGKWYRSALSPGLSWEQGGLGHAESLAAFLDLAVAAAELDYATALARQIEVMWNASDEAAPFTFFGARGWTGTAPGGEPELRERNEALLALQLLALRRTLDVRSFDDRIVRWAESLPGERPVDAVVFLLAYEVSRKDEWLDRALVLAGKSLPETADRKRDSAAANLAAQVLAAASLGATGAGEGRFPWPEVLFADGEGRLGLPEDVAATTIREGSEVRCRFYNVGSASQAVTLMPPFEGQVLGRVRTFRAKVLGWPGRGVTVRVLPGYNTAVIAELPRPTGLSGWDPPAAGVPVAATPSLDVLAGEEEVERARSGLLGYFLKRASDLDRQRWLALEALDGERALEKYRVSLRSRLLQALGGLPSRTPLNPKRGGTIRKTGFRIEKWIIESRPGFLVPLNLYLPENAEGPVPGVLVLCGHEPEGKAAREYQALCIDLVREGYVALVHDPLGQGERGTYNDPSSGNEHYHAGNQCYLLGSNLAQFLVWDAMRALDFLVSRPEVDPDLIGCTGSNGGGALTQYVAALDARVRAAAPACYPCDTFAAIEAVGAGRADEHPEEILFGELERGIDQFGRSLLMAPRPLLINAAIKDFVPIEGTRLLHRRLQAAYGPESATEALALYESPGGHGYSGDQREASIRFLNRWLKGKEGEYRSSAREADLEIETALACAPGMNVANLGSESVQSLVSRESEALSDAAPGGHSEEQARTYRAAVKERVRSLLRLPAELGVPSAEDHGALRLEDAIVRKVVLHGGSSVPIPVVVVFRSDAPADARAVICLGDRGKPGTEGEDTGVFLQLVKRGFYVIGVDPRGMGETRLDDSGDYYSWRKGTEASLAYRSFQIAEPLFGQRVRDVLTAVDFVCSGTDPCPQRVGIFGRGYGSLLALTAAALDERIAAVAAYAPLLSYRDLVKRPEYGFGVSAFIPGVLGRYDVDDLVASAAPRPVLLVNPVDAGGHEVDAALFRERYEECLEISEVLSGSLGYRFLEPDRVPNEVTEWLETALAAR